MQSDLRAILTMLRDGVAIRGTEGGLQIRRTVPLVEEFDTEIEPTGDVAVPLTSAQPIDYGDVLLLLPEASLFFFFGNTADANGIEVGGGGCLLIMGGDLGVNPPINGVVLVKNTGTANVRLRGLVGGTVQVL